jgi:hypothetical protein
MGFAPLLEFRAARSLSTLPLHDGFDIGMQIGFRAIF